MARVNKIKVLDNEIVILYDSNKEYISLTDMLKAKDGDFFISDWPRNRNTVEYPAFGNQFTIRVLIIANSP
jgi:hypothetical protein